MVEDANRHRQVAKFYDEEYHRYATSLPFSRHLYALAAKIRPNEEDYVLDIACGTGAWLDMLGRYSGHTFGIDISGVAVRSARDNLGHGRFCVGLGENLPFQDECFDLITCLGSLEHFLDQPGALHEICRVARDTARVLVLVPNSGFLTFRLGLFCGTDQSRIRETLRSIDEWREMFGAAGLDVSDAWADLHVLNREWILRRGLLHAPLRALQALMLLIWPLKWQYQIYFLCNIRK